MPVSLTAKMTQSSPAVDSRVTSSPMVPSLVNLLALLRRLWRQYLRYLGRLLQGDLGRSYLQRTEVSTLILSRLPATLLLMAGAILTELVIGLGLGILAATRRGRFADRAVMLVFFAAVSAPQFVIGILLLYLFSVQLGWLPLGGYGTASHLVLPALTLGILGAGWYARMMRGSLLEVLRQDISAPPAPRVLPRAASSSSTAYATRSCPSSP